MRTGSCPPDSNEYEKHNYKYFFFIWKKKFISPPSTTHLLYTSGCASTLTLNSYKLSQGVKESSNNTIANNQKFNLKLRFQETYILMADCILSIFDVGRHILRKSMKTWRQVVATRDCKMPLRITCHFLPPFLHEPLVFPLPHCLLIHASCFTAEFIHYNKNCKCILSILFTPLFAVQIINQLISF